MTTTRRQHSGEFKGKVTLEAIRGERTLQELAAAYGVHPVQIAQWKKVALEELPTLFSSRRGTQPTEEEALKAALYQQIGQLKVELDWLKKKLAWPAEAKRALIEPEHPQLSLRRQCALLGLARAGVYDPPVGDRAKDLQLMRSRDAHSTETPLYGVRRMTAWKRRSWIEHHFCLLKHLLATEACQVHGEDAYYGHLVLRLLAGLVLLYTARVLCKGHVTMEEIVFSLKHHWRFLKANNLELHGLSWDLDLEAA